MDYAIVALLGVITGLLINRDTTADKTAKGVTMAPAAETAAERRQRLIDIQLANIANYNGTSTGQISPREGD